MTRHAFICDAVRTPFGRYGGALSSVRADDLGAIPLAALMARNPNVDWQAVSDVIFGCANQAGEDNRNVARMSALLAGLPVGVPGSTVNRLCGSGLDALGTAARAIRSGDADLMIAGGVESMSRAPFVMPKAESAFSRANRVEDTTIGWRFVNRLMKERFGVDSMPETAENVATEFKIEREAQDRDPMSVLRSAREFAQAELADHKYVLVLHDHQANPHIHISVRAESKYGTRLNPRKADLQRWRETFAEKLRGWGIDAEASRQASRGVDRSYPSLWRKKAAEEGRERHPRPGRKTGPSALASRKDAGIAWANLFLALRASDDSTDRSAAAAIERWVKERSVIRDAVKKPVEQAFEPKPSLEPMR